MHRCLDAVTRALARLLQRTLFISRQLSGAQALRTYRRRVHRDALTVAAILSRVLPHIRAINSLVGLCRSQVFVRDRLWLVHIVFHGFAVGPYFLDGV